MMIKNIFIVDDDIFYANILENKIEAVGSYQIEKFHTGQDCINNAHKQPDIIFLDHFLGDTNGFEVLKDLKSTYPDIHVLMLSGQEELQIAVKTLKYGATDYLIKNSDDTPEKLLQIINDCGQLNKLKTQKKKKRGLLNFIL
ncbi:response regulator [Wenyingzhuangia aestuarii]|uniref:response regulator n=1 Tax=Wenyingzhuangia aestuarii TaxID=1647582 RepID=UPI00143C5DEA|nr:response regulator [Wenyingzhuangia aestuarii]NJB82457.1 DNA-binding NtrC family response regulator [Wenyingzhuangia aestuarii]